MLKKACVVLIQREFLHKDDKEFQISRHLLVLVLASRKCPSKALFALYTNLERELYGKWYWNFILIHHYICRIFSDFYLKNVLLTNSFNIVLYVRVKLIIFRIDNNGMSINCPLATEISLWNKTTEMCK